jgi:hypothetical protein
MWSVTSAAMAITVVLTLAAAPAALAQNGTLGSPLTNPPNYPTGCEAIPSALDFVSGTPVLEPSGSTTCTWVGNGVQFDVTNPLNSVYVPASGTVTAVRVRSSSNPAPLQRRSAPRTPLGRGTVRIPAGRTATVRVRLSAAGRRALRGRSSLAANAVVRLSGGSPATLPVTIRR